MVALDFATSIGGGTTYDPVTGAATSFAVMLYAGAFSISLDIAPSAGPFDIAAVGEGAASVISIDPTRSCVDDSGATSPGTYTGLVSTITFSGVARMDYSLLGNNVLKDHSVGPPEATR